MRPIIVIVTLVAAGCGGGGKELPNTKAGSFAMIEGSVNDIVSTVMSPTYKPRALDLGTDSDRVGLGLATFVKQTEGTPLATDAQELKAKFDALEKLAAQRAPVAKQREAAKAVQEVVASIKKKL